MPVSARDWPSMSPSFPERPIHRFPFVLFDRPGQAGPDGATAIRLASIDDALHEGHAGTTFAQSLLVEAMAQSATLFAREDGGGSCGMLVGLSNIRFGRVPRPGERLVVEARLAQKFGGLIRIGARVSVGAEMLAEGEVLISITGGDGSAERGGSGAEREDGGAEREDG